MICVKNHITSTKQDVLQKFYLTIFESIHIRLDKPSPSTNTFPIQFIYLLANFFYGED